MRNENIQDLTRQVNTDAKGEALAADLQEGDWTWQVTAHGHHTVAGTVKVVADQVAFVDPLLSRNVVTVNFFVEPVPFTDRYEIKIEQTFETHVPVPVLVVDPPYLEFDDVRPGFETSFIASVKNYGLITIHDLEISSAVLPQGTLEPLITYVPELKAFEEILIPYRATYSGGSAPTAQARLAGQNPVRQAFGATGTREPGFATPSPQPGFQLDLAGDGGFSDFADCATGGWASLAQDLLNLHSALQGQSFCATPAQRRFAFNAIATILIAYNIWSNRSILKPLDFLTNAVQCALKQIPFGGGGGGGGTPQRRGAPSYGHWNGPVCFTAGTQITLANGDRKPIEEIGIADEVMTYDGNSAPVSKLHRHESDHVREIWYEQGDGQLRRLETTDEHLFWVEGDDWTAARRLEIGSYLTGTGGDKWKVVRNERFEKQVTVYNFDIDGYNSYFANGILVHEQCGLEQEAITETNP